MVYPSPALGYIVLSAILPGGVASAARVVAVEEKERDVWEPFPARTAAREEGRRRRMRMRERRGARRERERGMVGDELLR